MKKVKIILTVSLLMLGIFFFDRSMLSADAEKYTYGDKSSTDYIINGIMPSFVRSTPISDDDPSKNTYKDSESLNYDYGYVFNDVNDFYFYNHANEQWEGNAPIMDTGVLIGGNAYSKHDARELDYDPNDFNKILPYANIYIDPEKLSYAKGEIEYEFFSDLFNYNNSENTIPDNIHIAGNAVKLTTYQQKFPDTSYPHKHGSQLPLNWQGIVYTGGIAKTIRNADGSFNETVVSNENNKLFTVKYKDAAVDDKGNSFDLLLTFKKITFVAEADVTGAFEILEANNLYVAPILYEDGNYTVVINDPSNKVDVHDLDGVRIGARYEYDYELVSDENIKPEGYIMFSMNDIDNASMANSLQTDADWGSNALGNDFKWAEGFGIVDGAASFAVIPYFNHGVNDVNNLAIDNHNGDTGLLRISRIPGSKPSGNANGLYFSTAITSVSGYGARNDADTLDTGISLLIKPKGSFISTISAGRRGDVNITLFDSSVSNRIKQACSEGGRIYSYDHSFNSYGVAVENPSSMKVVGGGTTSTHYMEPEGRHRIYRVRIDDVWVYYRDLIFVEQEDGTFKADYTVLDEYGKKTGSTQYHFYRNNDGLVWVSFEGIQDNHEIYAQFARFGLFGVLRSVSKRVLIAVFLIAGFGLLVIISLISWMTKGRKRQLKP